jgi:hypothetical protein
VVIRRPLDTRSPVRLKAISRGYCPVWQLWEKVGAAQGPGKGSEHMVDFSASRLAWSSRTCRRDTVSLVHRPLPCLFVCCPFSPTGIGPFCCDALSRKAPRRELWGSVHPFGCLPAFEQRLSGPTSPPLLEQPKIAPGTSLRCCHTPCGPRAAGTLLAFERETSAYYSAAPDIQQELNAKQSGPNCEDGERADECNCKLSRA